MTDELKACPWCQYKIIQDIYDSLLKYHFMSCTQCACQGPPGLSLEEAIAAWNTRAATSDPSKITGSTSDGYHTFDELYEHRHALFIQLMKSHPKISWRANNNSDGSNWENWFIAGMHLPSGDVSYHLPVRLWDSLDGFGIATTLNAPPWDGHTSYQVIDRLKSFLLPPPPTRSGSEEG